MADASNYPNVLPSDHDSDPKSPCASPDVVMTAPEVRPSHAEHQSQILEEQSNAHGDAHANLNIPKQRSRSPVASTHSNTSRNAINGVADNRSPPHTNGEHKSPDPLPKAISEDSEAETEILATPRKLQIRRLSDSSDDGHPVEPYSARKRRASGQPNVEHAEEAEGPHEFRSRKRARLHKNEDEEAWEEDTTSNEPEERERKPRLTRKAESESRIHTSKDDNLHLALDISRATTVPPKAFSTPTLPKPQPPSPTHRRDSSVHSSTTAPRPKDVDRNGRTPLARACHDGDAERVSTLIIAPNDMLNRPDYAGNTPLPLAVAKGHTEVVSMLIEAGADVNNVNHQGETPLKDAIDRGDVDVIGLLRRAGAVLKPPKESKPLDLPRHRRHFQHPSSAAALLDYINTDDDEGIGTCLGAEVTPNNDCVIAAVCSEKPHYLEMMLGFGGDCDPDPERVDNKTPMVVAIESGNLNAVQLLLQNGAHPRRLVFDDVDYKALIDDIGGQNSQEIGSLLDEALRNAPIRDDRFSEPSLQDQQPTVDEKQVRQEYLESLPMGLSKVLEGGEKPFTKTLRDWQPIHRVRLEDIDSECDPDNAEESWILNVFASVFLGHRRLDDITKMVSDTREVSEEQRQKLWSQANLSHHCVMAARFNDIADLDEAEELLQEHQIPYSIVGKNIKMISVDWQGVQIEQRDRWMRLPKESIFWVRLGDFLELTKSNEYAHLHDYPMIFDPPLA